MKPHRMTYLLFDPLDQAREQFPVGARVETDFTRGEVRVWAAPYWMNGRIVVLVREVNTPNPPTNYYLEQVRRSQ